jgi:hypothetical protein
VIGLGSGCSNPSLQLQGAEKEIQRAQFKINKLPLPPHGMSKETLAITIMKKLANHIMTNDFNMSKDLVLEMRDSILKDRADALPYVCRFVVGSLAVPAHQQKTHPCPTKHPSKGISRSNVSQLNLLGYRRTVAR